MRFLLQFQRQHWTGSLGKQGFDFSPVICNTVFKIVITLELQSDSNIILRLDRGIQCFMITTNMTISSGQRLAAFVCSYAVPWKSGQKRKEKDFSLWSK